MRFFLLASIIGLLSAGPVSAAAVPRGPAVAIWRVEDLKRGMKGHGLTVLKGTRVETFQAEILGVMRNTSPGRDMILARLSGIGLEKSGVIAGMSGSPVYIEGKLVGAVAYAWPYGKEPIAGITPFSQMQAYANVASRPVPLKATLRLGHRTFDRVTVSQDAGDDHTLRMVPLRTPLAATGFSARALRLLGQETSRFGMVPMQGGAVGARIAQEEKNAVLEPGGPLSVSLISGDFDLSGIGTVTHVEGDRVWGWGHPFMSLGGCALPMSTGYIHAVYPRRTVSFKMGSPLKEVGVLNADVSTCVAGTIGLKADMLPLSVEVSMGKGDARTFHVRIARHRTLLPSLVFTALSNAVDMEGELPNESTAHIEARIELANGRALTFKDTLSGFSASRGPSALFSPIASAVAQLAFNPFKELKVKRIVCSARVEPTRATAEIDAVELASSTYAPGETVKAFVWLKPYRGERQRVEIALKLPVDLEPGEHTAVLCDETSSARQDVRNNPNLLFPARAAQVIESLEVLAKARRNTLVLRVPLGAHGVVTSGKALPTLPGSVAHILISSKRTGTLAMSRAAVARKPLDWVIQGSDSVTFTVVKAHRTKRDE